MNQVAVQEPRKSPGRPQKKIAHIVLSLQPGGLERFICNLATVQDDNLDCTILCLDEIGKLAPVVQRFGAQVELVQRKPGFDVGVIFRLASQLRRINPAAIHTHSLDTMFYGGCAALLARVPIRIHTQHNTLLAGYGRKDRIKFRLAGALFTSVIAVSDETKRAILGLGVGAGKVRTILNGIDERLFSPGRRRVDEKNSLRIGCVARLSPEKGVTHLIKAFVAVGAANGTQLVIVGDGPERAALEKQAAALGVAGSVIFSGFQEDVGKLLATLDLFVLPSLTEGIPLALLEAMAAGLPVIATRVGGVPEVVVDGACGTLVPPGDPGALARAMQELIANPKERMLFGAAARARIEDKFGLKTMALRYRALYTGDAPQRSWKKAVKKLLTWLPKRLLFWRGSTKTQKVALTFDDGPDPIYTPRILDALRQYDAKATFFVVGDLVNREPELMRQILAEGHEIGNHSQTHPDFDRIPAWQAMKEISQTTGAIEAIQEKRCRLFRPPKGKLCLNSLLLAWLQGMKVILWNVDLKDFSATSPDDITRVLAAGGIQGGDVVLYHGNSEPSIAALPLVLKAALQNGREAVTISQLQRG